MPTTPVLGLPYPESTDTADVPRDMQALALAIEAQSVLPPGCGQIWFSDAPPAGWALLNGQAIDAATNPKLAAIFGQSAGLITLPNLRQRYPMGADPPTVPLRSTGGANAVYLEERHVPEHRHWAYGSNGTYKVPIGTGATPWFAQQVGAGTSALALNGSTSNSDITGFPNRAVGAQLPVDTKPAYVAVNFIVKLG